MGFQHYVELVILLGTGELFSSFVTLGIHSAILREKNVKSIFYHFRFNIFALLIAFLLIAYFLIHGMPQSLILITLAISSSLVKLSRSLLVSIGNLSGLTISYFWQGISLVFCFLIVDKPSISSFLYFVIIAQIVAFVSVVPSIIISYSMSQGAIDKKFAIRNIWSFFVRDLASLCSVHLGRSILFFAGLVEVAGIFSICYTMHSYLLQILQPFSQIIRPRLRNLYSEKKISELFILKSKWQKYFAIIGLSSTFTLYLLANLFSYTVITILGAPEQIILYLTIMLIATLSSFYFDIYGVWTTFIFERSDTFIKYIVLLFSGNILGQQLLFFLAFENIGFLVGYVSATITNNIVTYLIFKFAIKKA